LGAPDEATLARPGALAAQEGDMQKTPNNLRLIWAEKLVLCLVSLVTALAAFCWVLVAIGAGPMGADHVLASIGTDGAVELGVAVLALWATFRALDFVAHGSTYKLFHTRRADAPVLPTRKNLLAH
jgi:hypothetical protein